MLGNIMCFCWGVVSGATKSQRATREQERNKCPSQTCDSHNADAAIPANAVPTGKVHLGPTILALDQRSSQLVLQGPDEDPLRLLILQMSLRCPAVGIATSKVILQNMSSTIRRQLKIIYAMTQCDRNGQDELQQPHDHPGCRLWVILGRAQRGTMTTLQPAQVKSLPCMSCRNAS